MKYSALLTALVAVFISGCSVNVETYEVNAAERACKDHGGIDRINVLGNLSVTCQDGFNPYLWHFYAKE